MKIPDLIFGSPIGPWHKWFAWRPVFTYDRRFVWMKTVWRQAIQKHDYLDGGRDFWFRFSIEEPH